MDEDLSIVEVIKRQNDKTCEIAFRYRLKFIKITPLKWTYSNTDTQTQFR